MNTSRRGFTLIELLIVVTIIGLLGGISLAALSTARQTARVARTKATIAKLDSVIMERYTAYQTRRIHVPESIRFGNNGAHESSVWRLAALRQTMRLEMPDRFSDIRNETGLADADPGYVPDASADPIKVVARDGTELGTMTRPSQSAAYLRVIQGVTNTDYAAAECLYLIVTLGDAESRGLFHESEIADVDADGLREFIDGWGNPIYFLRWAPGYTPSDVQPNVLNQYAPDAPWDDPAVVLRKEAAQNLQHDPFDPQRVDVGVAADPDNPPSSWRLLPLIVSAGPDGIYDLTFSATGYVYAGNPYAEAIGRPDDIDNTSVTATGPANGWIDSWDNITNHGDN